jgi:D-amino-acid dehydrogenase
MKVLVLGAGVIGVTTAWYLAKAGHEVTVIDRQPGPGLETSFANAGEVSPGYASPWAAPGIPLKVVKWLFMHHSPLVLRPNFDPRMWRWMVQTLRNCSVERYAVNKARMVRIAEYSRDCLKELRAETGITYDDRALGTLQLFRTQQQIDGTAGDVKVLHEFGVPYELLDADGCIAAEPGLAGVRGLVAGGLRLPHDETGDCHLFTQRLEEMARKAGVIFRFGTVATAVETAGDRVAGIRVGRETLRSDAYVVALGSFTPLFTKALGIEPPIYPVKGYSITVPIISATDAPVSTIMDETYKVAITRLGDRIRVGGTAELSGYNSTLPLERRTPLERSLADLFPRAGDVSRATFWCGMRPMTPDGTPVIGPTRLKNLYLNSGHGTLGWTMACGSGRILADLVGGTTPDIDVKDLALSRYG